MAKIINLETIKNNKLLKRDNMEALDVVKDALKLALNFYATNDDHHKAEVLLQILDNWDEFFEGEANAQDE